MRSRVMVPERQSGHAKCRLPPVLRAQFPGFIDADPANLIVSRPCVPLMMSAVRTRPFGRGVCHMMEDGHTLRAMLSDSDRGPGNEQAQRLPPEMAP